MQDATARSYTLQEAAALLGIGVNTLRRRIAAGQIRAEQVHRPQGHVWRVFIDAQHPPIDPTGHPPIQEAASTLPQPPTQPPAEALAVLVQATVREAITPLVELVERQGETIREQAATIGALSARLEAATRPESPPDGPGSTKAVGTPTEPPTRLRTLWMRWWLALAALTACCVALVAVLLVWGR